MEQDFCKSIHRAQWSAQIVRDRIGKGFQLAIGGFDETLVSVEDLDFAVRLKAHGQGRGQRYGTIWRNGITTSCRKCDQFGDWYIFLNPRLVKALFSGRNRHAADRFWYDADR